jgi:hypothetical protein
MEDSAKTSIQYQLLAIATSPFGEKVEMEIC